MKPAASLLVAVCLMAGCTDDHRTAASPPTTSPAAANLGTAVELSGCTNIGGRFGIPRDIATAFLPEDFAPVEWRAPETATLYVESTDCTSAHVAGADAGPARWFYAELDVVPPQQYGKEETDSYTVPVLTIASPASVLDAFIGWKVHGAAVGAITDSTDGAVHRIHVQGPTFQIDMEAEVQGASQPLPRAVVRLFSVQDRKVVGVIDEVGTTASCQAGTAVMLFQGDADVLGAALPGATGGLCGGYGVVLRAQA